MVMASHLTDWMRVTYVTEMTYRYTGQGNAQMVGYDCWPRGTGEGCSSGPHTLYVVPAWLGHAGELRPKRHETKGDWVEKKKQ